MFGVFDQLGNLGDETDASSSDEDSDERLFVGSQLWLVWLGTENLGFPCGLLQQESSCTVQICMNVLGLQGEGSTGDAAEFSQGLVSDVNSRVVLNRTATCGFMFSGELLKQLGAFRASCRNPNTGLPHAPTRGFGAPVFGLACHKIEIENSLEMALSKAKSGSAWQSHFWQCGTLRPARNTKLLHYASKSKTASFNATGEDHFLPSVACSSLSVHY